jgi:hypothetical protein
MRLLEPICAAYAKVPRAAHQYFTREEERSAGSAVAFFLSVKRGALYFYLPVALQGGPNG